MRSLGKLLMRLLFLLLGLVGLGMSLCGGFSILSIGMPALLELARWRDSGHLQIVASAVYPMVLAGIFLAIGIGVCRFALPRALGTKDPDDWPGGSGRGDRDPDLP